MSESEEENFCFFGKPLDPYDEDAFPKKRPISVEEQIATDTQGRRRFHGAFTGGFSAGFFNTVGSLEGWTPSEFKSTRQDKAKGVTQKPEDFMDDEDIGEFGIAHQTVKATNEFSTVKKRRRQVFTDGPIPGVPVLETLLTSGNDTIGYLLLKNIGIQEKIEKQLDEIRVLDTKVYGCQMPTPYEIPKTIKNKQYEISAIFKEFLDHPKANTFGLGYQGLEKSHINLFQNTSLVMKDKNNKKISISGQAFGVGAFEEEDDNIYAKEDMTQYDFELTKEKCVAKTRSNNSEVLFGNFVLSKTPLICKNRFTPPTIPHSFTGKHKVKKSRFEPMTEEAQTRERREINPEIRARYLGEETNRNHTLSQPLIEPKVENVAIKEENIETTPQNQFDIASILMSDRFVSASVKEDVSDILQPVRRAESTHGTKDMREAARIKMFGALTRVTVDWQPCSILCKRFNVPEPFMDRPEEKRKRTKNLIFEYQKHSEDDTTLRPGLSTHSNEIANEILSTDLNEPSEIPQQTLVFAEAHSATEIRQETHQNETSCVKDDSTSSLPIDITEKLDVAEKTDLFKAIFLSSSESEEEPEDNSKAKEQEAERTEELKSSVLSDQFLPKIKSTKEGILSNVSFHAFTNPKKKLQETGESESSHDLANTSSTHKQTDDTLSYGPKLPKQQREVKIIPKIMQISNDSEDEWVEKDKRSKKKKSKHKKNKKEKHKKSKRDKRKD